MFPKDFFKFDFVKTEKDYINKAVAELKDTEEDCGYIKSGDTLIIKHNNKIFVANGYWECDISD